MPVSLQGQLALMARYHGWATQRLLDSIRAIPDEAYGRDVGLFFGSIHGTLNHLLLTDSGLWFPRFAGGQVTDLALDAEMESERAVLVDRLVSAAEKWSPFVDGLNEPELADDLRYTMTTGQVRAMPLPGALLHVFNHATHHRGQISAAMSVLGFEYQPIDLPFLIFSEQSG